jgi:hypothetical protein
MLLPIAAMSLAACSLVSRCSIKRGLGTTAGGELAVGGRVSHTLDLTPDAQNDVYVIPRDSMRTGMTYTIYTTSAACTTFSANGPKWELRSPVTPQDPCAIISSDTLKQGTYTSGRARFGASAWVMVRPHEVNDQNRFKLWIIGSSLVPISYEVRVEWVRGHDC